MGTDYYSYVVIGINLNGLISIKENKVEIPVIINGKAVFDEKGNPVLRIMDGLPGIIFNGKEFQYYIDFNNWLHQGFGLNLFYYSERDEPEDMYIGYQILESSDTYVRSKNGLSMENLETLFNITKERLKSINIDKEPLLFSYSYMSW
jgi:hypothetical protein